MVSLYNSLFHCHLLYALEIWSSAAESLVNELYKKQKIAIQIITNSKYNAHTKPLFRKLTILPLPELITYTKAFTFQSFIQNLSPLSFNEVWKTNREHRMAGKEGRSFSWKPVFYSTWRSFTWIVRRRGKKTRWRF